MCGSDQIRGKDSPAARQCPLFPLLWGTTPEPEAENHAHRRVLVVDDDAAVANLTAALVHRQFGCDVDVARSGQAALERLGMNPVHVVIADMMMPGVHGLELIAAIRQDHPCTDVLVMTGFPDEFPYIDVVRAGARDFIMKPCQPAELEAKLLRIFQEQDSRVRQVIAENKYRIVFESNAVGMVLLEDGRTLTITDVNEAFCRLSGHDHAGLVGMPFPELLEPSERDRFHQAIQVCSDVTQGTISDVVLVRPSGRVVFLDISVTFFHLGLERVICLTVKDTTEKRELEEQLVESAQTDALTGLFNKRTFILQLDDAVRRALKDGVKLSLAFFDLDHFKQCNDRFGHQTGDRVLQSVGRLILQSIRTGTDAGFRYGGDEFAVLLFAANGPNALIVIDRIRKAFEQMENFGTSLSAGVAEYKDGMDPAGLLRAADDAVYKAKALGRNNVFLAQE